MNTKIISRYDSEGNEYFNDYHEFTKSIQEKLIPEKTKLVNLARLSQYNTFAFAVYGTRFLTYIVWK